MVSASFTSPETLLLANKPSGKGRWVLSGLVRGRRPGANIHVYPDQRADNAGRASLPENSESLIQPFNHEPSNRLVTCQPVLWQEQKEAVNRTRLLFTFLIWY